MMGIIKEEMGRIKAEREALGYCQRPGCRVVARWTEGIVRGQ
jgi:hypothetical protein